MLLNEQVGKTSFGYFAAADVTEVSMVKKNLSSLF